MASYQYDSSVSIDFTDSTSFTTTASRAPISSSFIAGSNSTVFGFASVSGDNNTIAYSIINFDGLSSYTTTASTGESGDDGFTYEATGGIEAGGNATTEPSFVAKEYTPTGSITISGSATVFIPGKLSIGNGYAFSGGDRISTVAIDKNTFLMAYTQDYSNGEVKIGTIINGVISYGTGYEFTDVQLQHSTITILDSEHFVVGWSIVSGQQYAKIGTISSGVIIFGSSVTFSSGAMNIKGLDSTHFLAVGSNWSRMCSISGTTITLGTSVAWGGISFAMIDSTHFISTQDQHAKVGTINDMTITFGAAAQYTTAYPNSNSTIIVDGKVVIAFSDPDGKIIVGTISGTTITFETEIVFSTSTSNYIIYATSYYDDYFGIAFADTTDLRVVRGSLKNTTFSFSNEEVVYTGDVSGSAPYISIDDLYTSLISYRVVAGNGVYSHVVTMGALPVEEEYTGTGGMVVSGNANSSYPDSIVGDTISLGSDQQCNSSVRPYGISSDLLDSTHQIVAYSDSGNSSFGTCQIGTISGTTITYGTEYVFENTARANFIDVTSLDSSSFVVAYSDDGDGDDGKVVVGSISGGVISYGTVVDFESSGATEIEVDTLDSTHFSITWKYSTNTVKARVGSVSGSTITLGSAVTLSSSYAHRIRHCALDSTHLITMYETSTSGYIRVKLRACSVSGTTITIGSENQFLPLNKGITNNAIGKLDSTHFLCSFRDENNNRYLTAMGGSISGTTVTNDYANATVFSSTNTYQTEYSGIAALSSTSFIIQTSLDTDSDHGYYVKGTMSGTVPTCETPVEFAPTVTLNHKPVAINENSFILSLIDNYKGTTIVGGYSSTETINYIYYTSGGMIVSGAATTEPAIYAKEYTPTGGAILGGSGTYLESTKFYGYTPSGGIVTNGTATIVHTISHTNYTATGGMVTDGAPSYEATYYHLFTATGYAEFVGDGVSEVGHVYNPSGGMVNAGSAAIIEYNTYDGYSGSGGMVTGGSADTEYGIVYTPTGGMVLGGSADYELLSVNEFTYTATGGMVLDGDGDYQLGYGYSGLGGLTVGGSATYNEETNDYLYTVSGGMVISGAATVEVDRIPLVSGGITVDGSIEEIVNRIPIVSGGMEAGGSVDFEIEYIYTVSGGAVLSGSAEVLSNFEYTGSGGITVSGGENYQLGYEYSGTGGSDFSGSLTGIVGSNYSGTGGAVLSGSSTSEVEHVYQPIGGYNLSGSANYSEINNYNVTGLGGITLNGLSEIKVDRTYIVSGGATFSGSAEISNEYEYAGSGGMVASGEAELEYQEYTGSGGMVVGGSAQYQHTPIEDTTIVGSDVVFNTVYNNVFYDVAGLGSSKFATSYIRPRDISSDIGYARYKFGTINGDTTISMGSYKVVDNDKDELVSSIASIDDDTFITAYWEASYWNDNENDGVSHYTVKAKKFNSGGTYLASNNNIGVGVGPSFSIFSSEIIPLDSTYSVVTYVGSLNYVYFNLLNSDLNKLDSSYLSTFKAGSRLKVHKISSNKIIASNGTQYCIVTATTATPAIGQASPVTVDLYDIVPLSDTKVIGFFNDGVKIGTLSGSIISWGSSQLIDTQGDEFVKITENKVAIIRDNYIRIIYINDSICTLGVETQFTSDTVYRPRIDRLDDNSVVIAFDILESEDPDIYEGRNLVIKDLGVLVSESYFNYYPSGGMEVDGEAEYGINMYYGTGGLEAGGSANITLNHVYNPSGGMESSGEADYYIEYIYTVSGGATLNGSADFQVDYLYTATNGAVLSGSAPTKVGHVYTISGGMETGGSIEIEVDRSWIPTGGANFNGSAPSVEWENNYHFEPTGNIGDFAGSAIIDVGRVYLVSGGAEFSGQGSINAGFTYVGIGGAVLSGSSTSEVEHWYNGSGGAEYSGSSEIEVDRIPLVSGGMEVAGNGVYIEWTNNYLYNGSGGLEADGSANNKVGHVYQPIGGLEANGSANNKVGHVYQSTGGMVLSGSSIAHEGNNFNYPPSGGMIISGSANNEVGHVYQPTSGAEFSGHSIVTVNNSYIPSGGMIASGKATIVFSPQSKDTIRVEGLITKILRVESQITPTYIRTWSRITKIIRVKSNL